MKHRPHRLCWKLHPAAPLCFPTACLAEGLTRGGGLTCSGSTTRATQIMMTTSSWDGQILGVTSP